MQLFEEIEGDLIQKFEKDIDLFGEQKAKTALVECQAGNYLRNKLSISLNRNLC